jgi:cytidylate kinase
LPIISISRQFGSGGKEIAEKISKKLNIPFYDSEIISIASKESNLNDALFENSTINITGSLIFSLYTNSPAMGLASMSVNDRIFVAQSDAIKKLAASGSCVIVGRCSDYVLAERSDLITIFVHASLSQRTERAIAKAEIAPEKASAHVLKMDKKRASYYNFYTNRKWGQADNYDLCLNAGMIGTDDCAEIICKFAELKFKNFGKSPIKE